MSRNGNQVEVRSRGRLWRDAAWPFKAPRLRLLERRESGIALALLILGLAFSALAPSFATSNNLLNVTRQASIMAVLASGMTLVILTGGIDLSVGSTVALVGVIATDLMVNRGIPVLPSVTAAVMVGLGVGLINGLLVALLRIPPFIVTLGTMTGVRGLTYLYTQGYPIYGVPASFGTIGAGYVGSIPIPTIIMVLVALATHVFLTRTTVGRALYAIGGNEEAAELSGIPVARLKVLTYAASGLFAAGSGIILAARLRAGLPTAGQMYELNAIAAVILGGASIYGGEGTVLGSLLGALFISVLANGLNLLNVDPYVLEIVTGAVIIVSVVADRIRVGRWRGRL